MVLIEELEKNVEWYRVKGKSYKLLSFSVRALYFGFFTGALVCMALFGAGLATVICGVFGVAAAMLDRLFNLTRNWVEFSFVEVSLSGTLAIMRYQASKNNDEAVLIEFKEAMKKIEAETLGWQTDVAEGIRELKSRLEANSKFNQ